LKNIDNINKFISEALAIEAEDAKAAGALGYMARALTLATMPHSKQQENEFTRTNGAFTMTMLAPKRIGLPYGSIPRLLTAWITTEAVRTQNPVLTLGNSLSQFMADLDLVPTGGRWGTITRLKEQMTRLFTCSISATYEGDASFQAANLQIADDVRLFWHPQDPSQAALWKSQITLGGRFYKEAINHPIPIDLRALKAIKRSPMALDIYPWLTYRFFCLKREREIPWQALQLQFGAGYPITQEGTNNFKKNFLKSLGKVCLIYQTANVRPTETGLFMKPSPPHVPAIGKARSE
jgi:hypothetical protein